MAYADEKYAEFERDGEDTVRNDLAEGKYLGSKIGLANEWLRKKDQARSEAFQASQAEIALRAAAAAEVAAAAALRAAAAAEVAAAVSLEQARTARQALIIAIVAAIIALTSIIMNVFHSSAPGG